MQTIKQTSTSSQSYIGKIKLVYAKQLHEMAFYLFPLVVRRSDSGQILLLALYTHTTLVTTPTFIRLRHCCRNVIEVPQFRTRNLPSGRQTNRRRTGHHLQSETRVTSDCSERLILSRGLYRTALIDTSEHYLSVIVLGTFSHILL